LRAGPCEGQALFGGGAMKGMITPMGILKKIFGSYSERELKRVEQQKQAVLALEQKYREMSEADLKGRPSC
jgi:hypothetical protein